MAATAPSSSLLVAPAQAQDKMSCTVAAICALQTTQHSACLQVQQMAATAPSSSLLVAPAQAQGKKLSCTVAAICALQTIQHSACLQVQQMAATAPSSSLLVAPAQAQGKKLSCTVAAICALQTTQHSACLQVQQMAATAPSSSLLVAPAQAQGKKLSCTVAAICALQTTQHSVCLQVQQMAATAPTSSLLFERNIFCSCCNFDLIPEHNSWNLIAKLSHGGNGSADFPAFHPAKRKEPSRDHLLLTSFFVLVQSKLSDLREFDQKLGHSPLHTGTFLVALSVQSLDFRSKHLFHTQRPPVETIEDTPCNTEQ